MVAFDRAGQNPDALTVLDTDPGAGGGRRLDEAFFPRGEAFRGLRAHQVRLQGGDASSDSYCYRS